MDTLTRERRSWNMSRIKGKDTNPELLLRSLLHQRGFRFRTHDKHLPGTPDIVLPRYKTVIFVNGCFWHRHAGCKYTYTPKSRQEFWLKKFEETIQRNKKNQKILKGDGWNVIVVWECELNKDSDNLVKITSSRIKEKGNGDQT